MSYLTRFIPWEYAYNQLAVDALEGTKPIWMGSLHMQLNAKSNCNKRIQKVLGNYDTYVGKIRKIGVNNTGTQIIVVLVYGSYLKVIRPHTQFGCKMEKQMTSQVDKMVMLHMDHITWQLLS